jgi:hypothetical protein
LLTIIRVVDTHFEQDVADEQVAQPPEHDVHTPLLLQYLLPQPKHHVLKYGNATQYVHPGITDEQA